MTATPPASAPPERPAARHSAEHEHRYHSYVGSRIPWYVRLIWVLFWAFAAYYVIAYLFPALQAEIGNPP
jgi:hypothetical protein